MEQPEIISLREAKRLGFKEYFTGKECPYGHISKRVVSSRGCYECAIHSHNEWVNKNPDKLKIIDERSYSKNKKKKITKQQEWCKNNYSRYLWRSAKNRAKMLSIEFNITPDDIVIPIICPVLGFPLQNGIFEKQKNREFCPSLDRIDPIKGYTKGNVRVISYRANRWKSDMTLDEMRKIVQDMEILGEQTNG